MATTINKKATVATVAGMFRAGDAHYVTAWWTITFLFLSSGKKHGAFATWFVNHKDMTSQWGARYIEDMVRYGENAVKAHDGNIDLAVEAFTTWVKANREHADTSGWRAFCKQYSRKRNAPANKKEEAFVAVTLTYSEANARLREGGYDAETRREILATLRIKK